MVVLIEGVYRPGDREGVIRHDIEQSNATPKGGHCVRHAGGSQEIPRKMPQSARQILSDTSPVTSSRNTGILPVRTPQLGPEYFARHQSC
jgi:hypothetical protein